MRPGFNPWVGKIPWRKAWQPTPVFLPTKFPWMEESGGLQRHDWATSTAQTREKSDDGAKVTGSAPHCSRGLVHSWMASDQLLKRDDLGKNPNCWKTFESITTRKKSLPLDPLDKLLASEYKQKNQGHSPIRFVAHLPWSQTAYLWNRSASHLRTIL